MATQAALISRLRRLIDDVGQGYSQSAPGFSIDLSAAASPLRFGVYLDAGAVQQVTLSAPATLSTGQAIAADLQTAIRALFPTQTAYATCAVTFSRQDGYVLRSGTKSSLSSVRVVSPTSGTDAAALLKLGQAQGGYETVAHTEYSDAELGALLDEALAAQNAVGTTSLWDYPTIPTAYDTLVAYRGWASVIDMKLGQSAVGHWQKVEAEESHEDQVFANYLKLADWTKKRIAEMQSELEGGMIVVSTASRWSAYEGSFIAAEASVDHSTRITLLSVAWDGPTEAVIEFGEVLSTNLLEISLGYVEGTGSPLDRSVYSDPDYGSTYASTKGFVSPSVLARTVRNGRNTFLRVPGLDDTKTYTFSAVSVDMGGVRQFSNDLTLPSA